MTILERIHRRAAASPQRIVLPEGEDPRMVAAAAICQRERIAKIIMLGDEEKIRAVARETDLDLRGIKIMDHRRATDLEQMAALYLKLQRAKRAAVDKPRPSQRAMMEQAQRTVEDPLYYGNLMVRLGRADGSVAGATNTTPNTVRAALHCIGMRPGFKLVSSFFIMILRDKSLGADGALIYSDCGIVIDPSSAGLAEIAISSADSCRTLLEVEPRIALLSFSTRGSVKHPLADKVAEATRLVRARAPELIIDGELQADVALDPQFAWPRERGPMLAGRANVLIFPDLNTGNIANKLTERLAGATAIGAILQGLNKPANDLSRGCNVRDVIDTITITAVQSQVAKRFDQKSGLSFDLN